MKPLVPVAPPKDERFGVVERVGPALGAVKPRSVGRRWSSSVEHDSCGCWAGRGGFETAFGTSLDWPTRRLFELFVWV
jgi:hypothetical protein